jgi:hypothetical protein
MLRVEATIDIVVLATGQQLLQRAGAVIRKRECFANLEVHRGRVSGTTRRMFRLALVLVLAAGVVHAAPSKKPAESQKSTSKKTSKTTAKTDKKSKKRSKKKGKRSESRVPVKPGSRTLSSNEGMPRGFSWPPTRAMEAAGRECESKLDRAGVVWERADAEGRIANPIHVPAMEFGGIKYTNMWGSKAKQKMDCQLALALETIGPELHAIGVREVRFGSIFRFTNVKAHGKRRAILSRHGIGLAMDIGSFVDEAGRVVVVKTEYPKEDVFLLSIEQVINANGNFRLVLSPKNDPIDHDDHFHIEARSDFSSPDVP